MNHVIVAGASGVVGSEVNVKKNDETKTEFLEEAGLIIQLVAHLFEHLSSFCYVSQTPFDLNS